MDRGLDDDDAEKLRNLVLRQHGVEELTFFKSRRTGARYWVDVGVIASGDMGIGAADELTAAIRHALSHSPLVHHVEVFISPPLGESPTTTGAVVAAE